MSAARATSGSSAPLAGVASTKARRSLTRAARSAAVVLGDSAAVRHSSAASRARVAYGPAGTLPSSAAAFAQSPRVR